VQPVRNEVSAEVLSGDQALQCWLIAGEDFNMLFLSEALYNLN
jgi:hypothetical protein